MVLSLVNYLSKGVLIPPNSSGVKAHCAVVGTTWVNECGSECQNWMNNSTSHRWHKVMCRPKLCKVDTTIKYQRKSAGGYTNMICKQTKKVGGFKQILKEVHDRLHLICEYKFDLVTPSSTKLSYSYILRNLSTAHPSVINKSWKLYSMSDILCLCSLLLSLKILLFLITSHIFYNSHLVPG